MRFSSTEIIALCLSLIALAISFSGRNSDSDRPEKTAVSDQGSRLLRIEEEIARLREQMNSTAAQNGTAEPINDVSRLVSRLEALEARAVSSAAIPEELKDEAISVEEMARTRRAIAEVRRSEMDARVARWVEKERQKSERLLADIEEQLNLPWAEQERVRLIMSEESSSHAGILEEMWSMDDPTSRSEEEALALEWDQATLRMKQIRLERDQQLESLLGRERFDQLLKIVQPVRRSNDEQQNKTP